MSVPDPEGGGGYVCSLMFSQKSVSPCALTDECFLCRTHIGLALQFGHTEYKLVWYKHGLKIMGGFSLSAYF
jgi:hypothetical protein